MSTFFGVDFDKDFEAFQLRELLRQLFVHTATNYGKISSPFAGYLEAPEEIHELYRMYGARLSDLVDKMKEVHSELLNDLYRRIYSDTQRSITSRMLKRCGFDDSSRPDWDQDWWCC